jgi:DNA-binding response OmpR family regulator
MATVLVIESDDEFRVALASALRADAYTALVAANGQSGLAMVKRGGVDLIIMDISLPDLDGEKLLQDFCANPLSKHMPVLVVSEKCSQKERIRGLELGASDYIGKPVSRKEIVLRANIAIRRGRAIAKKLDVIRYDRLLIESIQRRVVVDQEELTLTPIEFKLLTVLADRPNQVQSRQSLLAEVWGMQSYLETRTVDAHIKRLREKLGGAAEYIRTVRGVGYRFSDENERDTAREVN